MNDQIEKMNEIILTREVEDTIGQIILACGIRPLKEKVTLLYLTIDYIFEHNVELRPVFCDEVIIH